MTSQRRAAEEGYPPLHDLDREAALLLGARGASRSASPQLSRIFELAQAGQLCAEFGFAENVRIGAAGRVAPPSCGLQRRGRPRLPA